MEKGNWTDKIFEYLIAIALVSFWVWLFIDAKNNPNSRNNSYCDYNDCSVPDPRS